MLDVRLCLFIDNGPPAALPPTLLVGDTLVPDDVPFVIELVVDDRGREDDEASFDKVDPPDFLEALCGVPEVRFLYKEATTENMPKNQSKDDESRGTGAVERFGR